MLDQNGPWYETKEFIMSLKDDHGREVVNKWHLRKLKMTKECMVMVTFMVRLSYT